MNNELQHYGVMGMKWGKRGGGEGGGVKKWAKERVNEGGKLIVNSVKHPLYSAVGAAKTIPDHKLSFVTGGAFTSNKQIKEVNANTDAMVAAKKAKNAAKAKAHAASTLAKHGAKKVSAI